MARRKAEPPPEPQKRPRRLSGEGTVVALKDGAFRAAVTVTQPDGSRKRVWFRRKTRDAALAAARAHQTDAERGQLVATDATPLRDYLAQWLERTARRVNPRTLTAYGQHVKHIDNAIGGYALGALKAEHMARLHHHCEDAGLAPITVGLIYTTLKRALDEAVNWEKIPRNPARTIRPPQARRVSFTPLTLAQTQALLRYVAHQDDRLTALWVLLAETGLRIGEALGLDWSAVDLDGGTLTVRQQLSEAAGGRFSLDALKTDASRRTVPLVPAVVAALRRHRARQREERLKTGLHPEEGDLVFYSPKGRPYWKPVIRDAWLRVLDGAELPHVRLHDLRHGVATRMNEQGVDALTTSRLLGHASVNMTLNRYTHTGAGQLRAAVDDLDAVLRPDVAPDVAGGTDAGG